MSSDHGAMDALLLEERRFSPSDAFRRSANLRDPAIYDEAAADPESYWSRWAEELHWFEPWETVLEWDPPHAKWFVGGKLNVAYNCLDRHPTGPRR